MTVPLVERLALLVLLAGILVGLYLWYNRRTLRRVEKRVTDFDSYRPGLPALVYFTTPTCAPCRTMQRPAIERLRARFGSGFQVIEVDASARPDLARDWGVMTVPTTFVFSADGTPRYVNHGVADASTLMRQLELEDYSI